MDITVVFSHRHCDVWYKIVISRNSTVTILIRLSCLSFCHFALLDALCLYNLMQTFKRFWSNSKVLFMLLSLVFRSGYKNKRTFSNVLNMILFSDTFSAFSWRTLRACQRRKFAQIKRTLMK